VVKGDYKEGKAEKKIANPHRGVEIYISRGKRLSV